MKRDTTVQVTKLTEVDGQYFRGGFHVVSRAVADKIVEGGNAKILGDDVKKKTKAGDVAGGAAN